MSDDYDGNDVSLNAILLRQGKVIGHLEALTTNFERIEKKMDKGFEDVLKESKKNVFVHESTCPSKTAMAEHIKEHEESKKKRIPDLN